MNGCATSRVRAIGLALHVFCLLSLFSFSRAADPNQAAAGSTSATRPAEMDMGNGMKIKLVLIPAGKFMMGDAGSGLDGPAHEVTLTNWTFAKHNFVSQLWAF